MTLAAVKHPRRWRFAWRTAPFARSLFVLFLAGCTTVIDSAQPLLNEYPRCEDLDCGPWDVDDLGCVHEQGTPTQPNCTCSVWGYTQRCVYP